MKAIRPVLIIAAFFALCVGTALAKDTLRILAFSGYADHDWVVQFEKQFNATIDVTVIDTDDALWDKLSKNSGQDFDVFATNTAELQRYIDKGIASPINLEHIPNVRNQLPRFQAMTKSPGIMRLDKSYAIPYTYSEMGLIYDKKQFDKPPKTMAEMWDPKYKGKILLYDGTTHNFSFTALVLGIQNPFQLSDENFRKVVSKLVELRDNEPRYYTSPEDGAKEFRENKVALMFGNFGTQQVKKLQDVGASIGYVLPVEGSLAWLDCWAISSATKNRALAEQWINFTLSAPIAAALSERQSLANTLTKSSIKPTDKILWLEPVEDAEKRTRLWDRIRKDNARSKQF